MKSTTALWKAWVTVAMLIAGGVRASDGELLERYVTLAYDGDHVMLGENETALVVATASISLDSPAWTSIQYRRGRQKFTPITLQLGMSDNALPLSGPGEVLLASTNWDYASTGPGVVGLRIVRTTTTTLNRGYGEMVLRYHTLTEPKDRVTLAANDTAIVVGTVGYDVSYNWTQILYGQGTNDLLALTLPLGVNSGTMPLSGPGVIMLATNDASVFGANFTGAVGLKIVRTMRRDDRN